jgi:hypothetical protein
VLFFANIASAQPNGHLRPTAAYPVLTDLLVRPAPSPSPAITSTPATIPSGTEESPLADADGCWPDPLFEEHVPTAPVSTNIFAKSFADIVESRSLAELLDDDTKAPMANPAAMRKPDNGATRWGSVGTQSLFFLGIMHSWRLMIEPDTRAALKGPFWKDYIDSVSLLRGWGDGDSFLTNYVGHPMMGAIAGRILLQNQPASRELQPSWDSKYVKSRLKAFGFAFAYSLQFEIGLISEGTIGNAMPNQYSNHPFSYVDIVITPTLGTFWTVGEDLLDRYVIQRIERKTDNRTAVIFARGLINPTRAFSNLLRFKKPWYRDDRR